MIKLGLLANRDVNENNQGQLSDVPQATYQRVRMGNAVLIGRSLHYVLYYDKLLKK